jgi:hypothetical protein
MKGRSCAGTATSRHTTGGRATTKRGYRRLLDERIVGQGDFPILVSQVESKQTEEVGLNQAGRGRPQTWSEGTTSRRFGRSGGRHCKPKEMQGPISGKGKNISNYSAPL